MKILKVPLSTKNLRDLKKKFETFSKDVKKAETKIVDELIDIAEREIQDGYSTSPYEGYGEQYEIGKANSTNKKNTKKVFVRGNQVLYREFGTGTRGAEDAHPWKDSVNIDLNPYNSGETIREAPITISPETGVFPGELYWTFYAEGRKFYTTGIPSGKEVYKAARKTRDNLRKISKERLGEKISKL